MNYSPEDDFDDEATLPECEKCGCRSDSTRYNERTGEVVCEYCSESYDKDDFDNG